MEQGSARERCLALLAEVGIPEPFDIEKFAELVGERRGRPVVLQPMVGAQPPAYCVPKTDVDVVRYEAGTGAFHRDHLILHELAHLLLEHDPGRFWDSGAEVLLPDLDLDVVRSRMFARGSYDCPAEHEAELFATLVQQEVWRRERHRRPDGLAGRLTRALGSQARAHA